MRYLLDLDAESVTMVEAAAEAVPAKSVRTEQNVQIERKVVPARFPKRGSGGVDRDPDGHHPKTGEAVYLDRADSRALLVVLRGKRMSSRDLEGRMGWLGLRYSKAEGELLGSGLVVSREGYLEVVG